MGILVFLSKNLNQSKVLDLAVTEEGVPSLGRDGSTYQEYIVPAFLTQVDELEDVAVAVAVVDAVDVVGQALLEMVPPSRSTLSPLF